MSGNPFHPAEQAAPKVKCLLYGPSGIGKTYAALTAPGPVAVIDTEGGTAFYANRAGLAQFDVLPTKTFGHVEQALAYLKANPTAYTTLVIDPVTVLWETLQDAAQDRRADVRKNPEADLEMIDWQRIKRAYKRLMTDLVNLPMHVIVTAREADLTEEWTGQNGRKERVKIGVRPEAEKGTTYYFDTVIRLAPTAKGREAIVEKDRTGAHVLNARIPNPTFASLFDAVLAGEGTAARDVQSDSDAARIDATTTLAVEERQQDETLTSIGPRTFAGKVNAGQGAHSDLQWREMPAGWHMGFRVEGDGKNLAQVCVEGTIADALRLIDEPTKGQQIEVEGEAFTVDAPGKARAQRLIVSRIKGDGYAIPATVDPIPAIPAPEAPAGNSSPAGVLVAAGKVDDLDSLPW